MGAPAPIELQKWDLVRETHWTLDYIKSLSMSEIHEFYQIKDAKIKATRK